MAKEIPKTQRAVVVEKPQGSFEIKEIGVPEIAEDELLVNLEYSGICHSDVHSYEGDFGPIVSFPYIGGHEGAGTVVQVGKNVKNWKVGDKAGVQMLNNACGFCEYCIKERHYLCSSITEFGIGRPGTFQQYIAVKPFDTVKLPDDADLSLIAPVLCAGVTVYSSLRQCNLLPGEIVSITGAGGGLGSMAIQYANAIGYRVLAIDAASKEHFCRQLGAEFFIDAFSEKLVESVVEKTSGGPHAMINLAGSLKTVNDAILYLRKGSTIVHIAVPKDSMVEINALHLVMKALNLKGSMTGSRQEMKTAVDLVARGVVKIPIEVISMSEVTSAFEAIRSGKITGRKVVDLNKV